MAGKELCLCGKSKGLQVSFLTTAPEKTGSTGLPDGDEGADEAQFFAK
ncbi:hypothetical protein IFT84_09250 [Rhizobium sp. CFBP 8762]|nr:hypothetical protein [Rhizobium sp. CFBP 8762]MBD8554709.1 hypothetical protein [Rhizobium sp. CFBP 8762]